MCLEDKKTNDLQALGSRLQKARKVTTKKSKDVAKDLGFEPATVSAWENGKALPPFKALLYWANVLKCDLNWLFLGETTSPSASDDSGNWKEKYLSALEDLNKVHSSLEMVRLVHDRVCEENKSGHKAVSDDLAAKTNELQRLETSHHRLRQKYLVLQSNFQTALLNIQSLTRELEETKKAKH